MRTQTHLLSSDERKRKRPPLCHPDRPNFGFLQCESCYRHARYRATHPLPKRMPVPPGQKWCASCQTVKDVSAFGKNKSKKDGLSTYCLLCFKKWRPSVRASYHRNKHKYALRTKEYHKLHQPEATARLREKRKQNPDWYRDYKLRQIGTSLAEFRRLFEFQEKKCAICQASDPGGRGWHADHDHATNVFRGVLCSGCNTALGFLKDNPALLRRAADYLELTTAARLRNSVSPTGMSDRPAVPAESYPSLLS